MFLDPGEIYVFVFECDFGGIEVVDQQTVLECLPRKKAKVHETGRNKQHASLLASMATIGMQS